MEFTNVTYESIRKGADVALRYLEVNTPRKEVAWVKSLLRSNSTRIGIDVGNWTVGSNATLATDAAAILRSCDLLCVDASVVSTAALHAIGLEAGFWLEELLDVTVTERWRFLILGIRPLR
jgi:hypothetical protein